MSEVPQLTPLVTPVGGQLRQQQLSPDEQARWRALAANLPTLTLSAAAQAKLELLASGALSPLGALMGAAEYHTVLAERRLPDGTPFPWPVALAVDDAERIKAGGQVALLAPTRELLAVVDQAEVYPADPHERELLGHDAAATDYRLGGQLKLVGRPRYLEFAELRLAPAETRARLAGAAPVTAWQPSRLLHQGDVAALRELAGNGRLLLQLPLPAARTGDLQPHATVAVARAVAEQVGALLQVVPAPPDAPAERLALWRALVARNSGAARLLVDGAEPPAAVASLGVEPVLAPQLATSTGPLPAAATEVVAAAFPPPRRQGFCVWFTGLPSSGKSTVAEALLPLLLDHGRQVTLLDGDVVRTHLSKGLGFSKEDRDINIRRIGFVAAEIVRHHGVVVVAAVSPYEATREEVREMVGGEHFVLVHVATPVEVCEQRDAKGLYAQARLGRLTGFTGVDDPYEEPITAALRLDTVNRDAAACAAQVMADLAARGFVA